MPPPTTERNSGARRRPRQVRAQATFDTILLGAAKVLIADGYDKATTNRIAEVAGVSVGSLYQYFASKEALVAALAEKHVADTFEVLSTGLADALHLPIAEAARHLVSNMIRAHQLEPELHRVLGEQVPRLATAAEVRDVKFAAQNLVEAHLNQRLGELRPGLDAQLAAFIVVQSVESITHASVLEREMTDQQCCELIDEVSRLIVGYLTESR